MRVRLDNSKVSSSVGCPSSASRYRSFVAAGVAALVAILLHSPAALAQTATPAIESEVEYDESPEAVVLSFRESPGELAELEGGPTLRIYGDGRVEVEYPIYMRKAGRHELRMSRLELRRMLRSLADEGLAEFDEERLRGKLRRARTQQRPDPSTPLVASSDASFTEVDLELRRYRRAGPGGRDLRNVSTKVRWRGLRAEAERHRDIDSLQKLEGMRRKLHGVMSRPDLRRVP